MSAVAFSKLLLIFFKIFYVPLDEYSILKAKTIESRLFWDAWKQKELKAIPQFLYIPHLDAIDALKMSKHGQIKLGYTRKAPWRCFKVHLWQVDFLVTVSESTQLPLQKKVSETLTTIVKMNVQ